MRTDGEPAQTSGGSWPASTAKASVPAQRNLPAGVFSTPNSRFLPLRGRTRHPKPTQARQPEERAGAAARTPSR